MSIARNSKSSGLNFRDTVEFYNKLRERMYQVVKADWPGFQISSINLNNVRQADSWASSDFKERKVWSWLDAYNVYRSKSNFKRFDVSVTCGGETIGLSYGLPTRHKTKLKVDIIEATPIKEHKRGIQVFEIISECAQIYATLLGADEVRIMNPLNARLTAYYCSHGYELVMPAKHSLGIYCAMKIEV